MAWAGRQRAAADAARKRWRCGPLMERCFQLERAELNSEMRYQSANGSLGMGRKTYSPQGLYGTIFA